ncbi:hypothetical protein MP638_004783 [Amoeboaphelidium occidentale]|nr:hypothetical protein MP638_004783 [Amoeboaphelidium occidentale]
MSSTPMRKKADIIEHHFRALDKLSHTKKILEPKIYKNLEKSLDKEVHKARAHVQKSHHGKPGSSTSSKKQNELTQSSSSNASASSAQKPKVSLAKMETIRLLTKEYPEKFKIAYFKKHYRIPYSALVKILKNDGSRDPFKQELRQEMVKHLRSYPQELVTIDIVEKGFIKLQKQKKNGT